MKNKLFISLLLLFIGKLMFAQLPDIVAMEYYFDNDPGYANGISVPIVADTIIEVNFNADMSAVSNGFHILYVRTKDETGKWSTTFTSQVLKFSNPDTGTGELLPQITQMEYFFDTDPGFGNGTNVPVTSDSLTEVVFNADFSTLSKGFHILYVRTKDEAGKWSTAFTSQVFKFSNPDTGTGGLLPQITQMEYFFDTDPGFGNGTDITVTADSLTEVVFNADFSTLSRGFHTFFVRTKDETGKWSVAFTDEMYKFSNPEEGVLYPLPAITQIEYFFDVDPGFGNGSEIFITPDSAILENFIADINAIGAGPHLMFIRVKDENKKWSQAAVAPFCKKGLTVYLEGPYDIGSKMMSTQLNSNNLLPLEQPFDSDTTAQWYYNGDESDAAIPNSEVVDWLLLQARDATSPENATAETVKETQVAFLLKDGKIVGLDGESLISFSAPIENNLYLVVFQRNHAGVISSASIEQTWDCECTYNFSTSANQAYGGNAAHKEIVSGVWGMFGGDSDGNGIINTNDKTNIWTTEAGTPGYLPADNNLSGQVDNKDKNDTWAENRNKSSQVPE